MLVPIRRGQEEKGRYHFEKGDRGFRLWLRLYSLVRQLRKEVRRAIDKDCDVDFNVIEED